MSRLWFLLWLSFGSYGCATAPALDAMRDTIHAQHTVCLWRVAQEEHRHGGNAWALIQCDREEEASCRAASLERACGEWVSYP